MIWGSFASSLIAATAAAQHAHDRERRLVDGMRAKLSPEAFERWQAERTAERRHREVCAAIEQAGRNAKPASSLFGGVGGAVLGASIADAVFNGTSSASDASTWSGGGGDSGGGGASGEW